MIKKANNYCRTCKNFEQYYISGIFSYWSGECGFCGVKKGIVNEKSTCEVYCKQPRTPLGLEEVDYALDNVKQIEKLLKK